MIMWDGLSDYEKWLFYILEDYFIFCVIIWTFWNDYSITAWLFALIILVDYLGHYDYL